MKSYDTIIVGGGAAGMAAAVACSKVQQRILVLDRLDKLGKKILVTGNGRCNLTNLDQKPEYYRSEYGQKAWDLINRFTVEDTFAFFSALGLYTRDKDGYVYPYNEQASAVREAMESYLMHQPGIDILLEADVQSISVTKKGRYKIQIEKELYSADYLVLATGGMVGKKLGCDGTGYQLAKAFGHHMVPVGPALTALKSKAPFLKKVSGVRNTAKITLLVDGQEVAAEKGELQWVDYGISGVAVFQLSRYAVVALKQGKRVELRLNMMPEMTGEAIIKLLSAFVASCRYKSGEDLLKGIFPAKLAPVILREARISEELADWSDQDLLKLADVIQGFTLRIADYVGYEKAQVTSGGVSLHDLDENLQSLYAPGLYFAGEVLDVDGTCGGYNLQWAWTSGNIVGNAIASAISER